MPVIDAQVHCYERNHPGRPWVAVLHGPPEVTGPDMIKAMDEVGVDGALLVSVYTMYRFDESYAVAVQKAYPGRLAVIKPVNANDPAVGETIDQWKKNPGAVAIRIMMTPEVSMDPADPGINRVLAAAGRNGFPVNLLARGRMKQLIELAKRNPNTRLVIDHLGVTQPFEPPVPPDAWAELPDVLEVAKQPNVVIKVTGACTLSTRSSPTGISGTRWPASSTPSAWIAACGAPTGPAPSGC